MHVHARCNEECSAVKQRLAFTETFSDFELKGGAEQIWSSDFERAGGTEQALAATSSVRGPPSTAGAVLSRPGGTKCRT